MPHSHHSHSGQFCSHAKDNLEDIVQEAIRQKFKVYCLTEHCPRYRSEDLYPEEVDDGLTTSALISRFQDFLVEATRLKKKYTSEISLLIGVETEYITSSGLDELQSLLEAQKDKIDLVVGSVHHVNEIPIDFDKETFDRALSSFSQPDSPLEAAREAFLSAYLDAQYQVLDRLHPEILGHFDLFRLYTPELGLTPYPAVWEKIERNIKFAISYGALFEINAASFRKGWQTAYPSKDILSTIIRHGGRLALSDDSHGIHMVGLNYRKAREYLLSQGVQDLWYLKPSEDANVGGRRTQPTLAPDWQSDSFWTTEHPETVS